MKNGDMKTPEQTNPTTYSDRIMSTLYSTKVTATGGRHGHIRSEDGLLEMKLALPRELGGKGDATNPETLFAGGYAACFENALLRVSREKGLRFADGDVEVIAEIQDRTKAVQPLLIMMKCPNSAKPLVS